MYLELFEAVLSDSPETPFKDPNEPAGPVPPPVSPDPYPVTDPVPSPSPGPDIDPLPTPAEPIPGTPPNVVF